MGQEGPDRDRGQRHPAFVRVARATPRSARTGRRSRSRTAGQPRALGPGRPRRYLPVSSPLASGKNGTKPIPAARRRAAPPPRVAVEQAVLVLHARRSGRRRLPRDRVGLFELRGGEVGAADLAHLARGDRARRSALERLGDGRRRRRAVAAGRGRPRSVRRRRRLSSNAWRTYSRSRAALAPSSMLIPHLVASTTRSRRPGALRRGTPRSAPRP